MVAVLACGPRAVLSHGSAAALWGIGREFAKQVEVSLPATSVRMRAGVRTHRRPNLRASDITIREAIPVTGVVRTFIDIARRLDRARLERAINEADRLELVDPETLFAALDAYPGVPGVGPLRAILGENTFRLTDSELERWFLRLVRDVGLPMPLTRQHLNGFRVDFYWPDLGLVVETDGLTYHRTPAQQARDRLRDQAHTAAGLTHLRFTHAQVRFEAAHVRAILVETARRLGAVTGPPAWGRDRGLAP
jgi:very-short-patch-repair endonuclease